MPPTASPRSDDRDRPIGSLSRGLLIDVLNDAVGDLERLSLDLDAPGVAEARRLRDSLVGQVRDNVLPRLADADVPAIVVVGGSTGAGKSTLVNSVLGVEVSDAGVLRPTTRVPVLVVNPEDAQALTGHPVAQVSTTVVSPSVPPGLALVDASDLDSVQEANRELASRLLDASDLWLFVTTAARYGDLVPWTTLEQAAAKGSPIAVALNRAPARTLHEVRRDLLGRLEGLGLSEAPFFVVPDAGPHEGLLPGRSVAELRDWLDALAGRHRAAGLVRRTDRSMWASMRTDLMALADAADLQNDAAARLEATTRGLLEAPTAALTQAVSRGVAGDGAPATRWVSHAATGGALASLAQGGRLRRGWLGRAVSARTAALAQVVEELKDALVLQLSAQLSTAVTTVRRTWVAAGAHLDERRAQGVDAQVAVASWINAVHESRKAAGARAVKRLEPDAVADLIVAAAGGVEGAAQAASRLGLAEEVDAARRRLAQTLTSALDEALPPGAALAQAPDTSIAAALRLRASEITPLIRRGADA